VVALVNPIYRFEIANARLGMILTFAPLCLCVRFFGLFFVFFAHFGGYSISPVRTAVSTTRPFIRAT
jgi:hypothetical protein